ncbi:MAG: hypothetical protein RL701_5807, partial [Pseudomonadota bacterium]
TDYKRSTDWLESTAFEVLVLDASMDPSVHRVPTRACANAEQGTR